MAGLVTAARLLFQSLRKVSGSVMSSPGRPQPWLCCVCGNRGETEGLREIRMSAC